MVEVTHVGSAPILDVLSGAMLPIQDSRTGDRDYPFMLQIGVASVELTEAEVRSIVSHCTQIELWLNRRAAALAEGRQLEGKPPSGSRVEGFFWIRRFEEDGEAGVAVRIGESEFRFQHGHDTVTFFTVVKRLSDSMSEMRQAAPGGRPNIELNMVPGIRDSGRLWGWGDD